MESEAASETYMVELFLVVENERPCNIGNVLTGKDVAPVSVGYNSQTEHTNGPHTASALRPEQLQGGPCCSATTS